MSPVQAGKLRHRVTFLVPPDGCGDEAGGELPPVAGDTTWASIEFVSGFNTFNVNTFVAQATHKITMRYRAGVQPNWKISFGDRTFEILYQDNVEARREQLDLYCVELNGVT
jgi:SPP1 family predicted phage head-tail adaptor